MEVTFKQIAKMLAKALPLEGEEFGEAVNLLTRQVGQLSSRNKLALRAAYIFSQKVPKQEREDLFQDLFLTLWQAKVDNERLAYAIARCDWQDWWKRYVYRQHYSLDSIVENEDGSKVPFAELLVGEVEYEKLDGDMDGKRLFDSLPYWVKQLVDRRLQGKALNPASRKILDRWVASRPMQLVPYQG